MAVSLTVGGVRVAFDEQFANEVAGVLDHGFGATRGWEETPPIHYRELAETVWSELHRRAIEELGKERIQNLTALGLEEGFGGGRVHEARGRGHGPGRTGIVPQRGDAVCSPGGTGTAPRRCRCQLYGADALASSLAFANDHNYDPKNRKAELTAAGRHNVRAFSTHSAFLTLADDALYEYVERALRVRTAYFMHRDYVVVDGKIVMVDELADRLMPEGGPPVDLRPSADEASPAKPSRQS